MTRGRPIASGRVGIGLHLPHASEIAAARPRLGFLEVHAENYMAETPALDRLLGLRRDYPVSLHGVALSLGSAERLDPCHLMRFKALIQRVRPVLLSEQLAWGAVRRAYLHRLSPPPYPEASLDLFCRHVDEAQGGLGRRLLIENPSSYLRYRHSTIPEAEFMTEVAHRTGCGILCDVNNVHVSAWNFGFDPLAYLDALPIEAIGEIHLAGHRVAEDVGILIDDRGAGADELVGGFCSAAPRRFGPVPAMVEGATTLPTLEVLLNEARHPEEAHRYVDAAGAEDAVPPSRSRW